MFYVTTYFCPPNFTVYTSNYCPFTVLRLFIKRQLNSLRIIFQVADEIFMESGGPSSFTNKLNNGIKINDGSILSLFPSLCVHKIVIMLLILI